jgi:hypothetical protein
MIGAFNDIQNVLSKAQAVPLLGMTISPVKAVVSLAQVITGITTSFFLTILGVVSSNKSLLDLAGLVLAENAKAGLTNFFYSVANFTTFTIVGVYFESSRAKKLSFC